MMKAIIYIAIIGIIVITSSCVHDDTYKFHGSIVPESLLDGWQVSTPIAEGIDPASLEEVYADFFAEDKYYNALSLLFVKNGKLISEGY
jgi:hypothetical protein